MFQQDRWFQWDLQDLALRQYLSDQVLQLYPSYLSIRGYPDFPQVPGSHSVLMVQLVHLTPEVQANPALQSYQACQQVPVIH